MVEKEKEVDTKERILNAAKSEFAANGFAGARMDAIAKRAKANKAMIHYYFKSKEILHDKVFEKIFMLDSGQDFPVDFSSYNLNPSQQMMASLNFMVCTHLENTDVEFNQILAWELAQGRKKLKKIAKDFFIPRIEKLSSIIEKGIETGEFETKYPLLEVFNIISMISSYSMQRETYVGTKFEQSLYNEITRKEMLEFISTHTFKAIAGKKKVNRELPKELIQKISEKRSRIDKNME